MDMETFDWGAEGLPLEEGRVTVPGRTRSPRMMASAQITVRPPRIMFCVPWIWERRETLFPVSWCRLLVGREEMGTAAYGLDVFAFNRFWRHIGQQLILR
jgi:hypothetical protein